MTPPTHHYRIDYHVHPNLHVARARASRRARQWWHAFADNNLDAVVITEHSYKRPRESFLFLEAARPFGATTEIFPGVEILTREGADLIVYSDNPKEMFRPSKLLVPYGLTYEKAVQEIEARGLRAYVTHPSTLGTTSILQHRGPWFTREMVRRLQTVERHNAAYLDIAGACRRTPMTGWIAKHLLRRIDMPATLYDHVEDCVWVGGSDAHRPHELGCYVRIPAWGPPTRSAMWTAMTALHGGSFVLRTPHPSFRHVAKQGATAFSEYSGKKLYKWRMRRTRHIHETR
jgi:hypothetical protein